MRTIERAHILEQIRARRAVLKTLGIKNRRRRLPRQVPPTGVAVAYLAAIKQILARARTLVAARLVPKLELWERQAKTWRGDAAGDEANDLIDGIAEDFFGEYSNAKIKNLASGIGKRTSDHQRGEWIKQTRAGLGVDVLQAEPWLAPKLETFAAENVALIKSLPTQTFAEIEKLVLRGVQEGVRPSEIASQIEERFSVAESRAALIARDQTNKLFGNLNEARQTAAGVTKYIWRTVRDERVRGDPSGKFPNAEYSHFDREGQVFSWDDPPEDGHPGDPINCRCQADPVLDDLLG